jgi:hypothetical protein
MAVTVYCAGDADPSIIRSKRRLLSQPLGPGAPNPGGDRAIKSSCSSASPSSSQNGGRLRVSMDENCRHGLSRSRNARSHERATSAKGELAVMTGDVVPERCS